MLQMNPAYAQAIKQTGGTDIRGLITDLGKIAINSLFSLRGMANATWDGITQYGIVFSSEAKAGYEMTLLV